MPWTSVSWPGSDTSADRRARDERKRRESWERMRAAIDAKHARQAA